MIKLKNIFFLVKSGVDRVDSSFSTEPETQDEYGNGEIVNNVMV